MLFSEKVFAKDEVIVLTKIDFSWTTYGYQISQMDSEMDVKRVEEMIAKRVEEMVAKRVAEMYADLSWAIEKANKSFENHVKQGVVTQYGCTSNGSHLSDIQWRRTREDCLGFVNRQANPIIFKIYSRRIRCCCSKDDWCRCKGLNDLEKVQTGVFVDHGKYVLYIRIAQ